MRLHAFSDILKPDYSHFLSLEISGLSSDSRFLASGDLFFALAGVKLDGSLYLSEAEKRGACAVVVSRCSRVDESFSLPVFRVENPRRALALCSSLFYPQQPSTIIAVTGTSGKTSVVSFLRQIWQHNGSFSASIGTTGVILSGGDILDASSLTTPDPVTLHRLLSELAESGITHVAMEASSHGLDQFRLDGVRLSAVAFTNLGHDHLDYHLGMEKYFAAKLRLFKDLPPNIETFPAVVFSDDPFSARVIEAARDRGLRVLTVGRRGEFIQLKRVEHERFRQRAELLFDRCIYEISLPLSGDFQICNALVAAGLAIATGTPAEKVFSALDHLQGASGRLELVGVSPAGAPVYVDYAHKPEALQSVLNALRPFTTGRLIVVFGCGGERDRLKRSIMGKIASDLADVVIVTDDNPRSESPDEIRAAILSMAPGALEVSDRREAIFKAVSLLQSGDVLVIAGKGHEQNQIFADKTLPFSDQQEARNALEELKL